MVSSFHMRWGFFALALALLPLPGVADDAANGAGTPQRADAFLAPPKAEEITAFANDVKLPRDFSGLAITVDKEKVLEFFSNGEAHPADRERAHWRLLADFTLPAALAASPALDAVRKEAAGMPNGRVYFNAFIHASGIVATKAGTIYFWRFWNDRVLEVEDEAGRGCVLALGENAKPFAQAAHAYGEYDGAADPEKKLYGKLAAPQGKDIVAFANRPGDTYDEHEMARRNYLSRERFDAYLTVFTPMARGVAQLCKFDGSLDPFICKDAKVRMNPQYWGNLQLQFEGANGADTVTDGALLTRDARVIFWRMGADGIFYLMDDHHRTNCVSSGMGGDTGKRYSAAYVQFAAGGGPKFSLLTYSELAGAGDWAAHQPPPLAAGDAARSAWKQFSATADAKGAKDAGAWRVSRVTTTRFTTNMGLCKWYYTVYFVKQGDPAAAETPVLVSMDGTAGGIYTPDQVAAKLTEAQGQLQADMQKRFRGRGFGGGGMGWVSD